MIRAITALNDDLDFDFAETATQESAVERQRGRGWPPVQKPLVRLLVLVVLTIIVVVTLAVVIGSATAPSKSDRYRSYLTAVAPLAGDSQAIGQQASSLLATGSSVSSAVSQLGSLAARQQQDLARLSQLRPPPAFRNAHTDALNAFALRLSGLIGLRDGLGAHTPVVANLLVPAEQLLASDVVWSNFYLARLSAQIRHDKLTGLSPPSSHFLANGDLAASSAIAASVNRLRGTGGAGAPLGTLPVLRVGASGSAVAAWQTDLNRWLARAQPQRRPLPADGTFGPATASATQALQLAQGLPADGIVGPKTRQALAKVLAGQK